VAGGQDEAGPWRQKAFSRQQFWFTASTIVAPVLLFVALGWEFYEIAIVLWGEAMVVGGLSVAKLLTSGPQVSVTSRLLALPAFVFFYGVVGAGLGSAVGQLHGPNAVAPEDRPNRDEIELTFDPDLWTNRVIVALAALAALQTYRFVAYFLFGGGRHRANLPSMTVAPFVMYLPPLLPLILSGGEQGWRSTTAVAIVLYLGLRLVLDLDFFGENSRWKRQPPPPPTPEPTSLQQRR
jgi:hypothetical protein